MERREYTRVDVDAQGAFFICDNGRLICDFSAMIDNVSEGGFGIVVEGETFDKVASLLEIGQTIRFQAYDANGYSLDEEEGTFQGEAEVVRKILSQGKLIVGCKIDAKCIDFKEYVKNKKVYIYVRSIRAMQ